MKKFSLVVMLILLAMPAFAQESEFVLSNSDIDALLGGGSNRSGRGNQNQPQIPDPAIWLADIKNLLKNNKVALEKDQEKALKAFLEKETVAMRTELETQLRGGNRGNNNQMTMITDLTAAVTKHNTQFLTEVKAGLAPDQASLITKAEKDKKVCSVALDLVNFQALLARNQNSNQGGRGGGRGGRGGGGGGGDFGGGGFSDFGGIDLSDLGVQTGGGGNRGGNQTNQFSQMIPDRASCTQSNSTTAQRLAVLSEILTKGKKPFTPDQETKVSALIEGKMTLITDELKAKHSNMDSMLNDLNRTNTNNNNQNQNRGNQTQTQTPNPPAPPTVNVQTLTNNIVNTIMQNLGIQTNNNNNNNQGGGRGGRGGGGNFPEGGRGAGNFPEGGRGGNTPAAPAAANANNPQNSNFQGNRGNNFNNFNPQQEIIKKTEELYDKVAAMLKPEQGALVKTVKYDQMKARGPVDRYRAILEQEGTPLTAEQLTQIQTMLNTQNQAIRDAASTLVTREIQALEPGAMQAVIDEYLAQQAQQNQQQQNPQQNRNNNNAVNNVNQNRVAQQIIQKTLPEVSKQKALLEGATNQQIQLRVFTPQQVASYKLSSMQ